MGLSLLVECAVKSSLVLLIAGVVSLALHRSSAAVRHFAWATTIAGVLLIAPLALVLPEIPLRSPAALAGPLTALTAQPAAAPAQPAAAATARVTQTAPAAPPASGGRTSLTSVLLAVCAAGSLLLAGGFVIAGLRLAHIARQSRPLEDPAVAELTLWAARQLGVDPARVQLRSTDRELTPMAWGLRRPMLILPAAWKTWDEERLRQVLVHEIGHVQRWDILTQALGNAACALYWFNPLVWMAARRMLVERERACDDLVLASGAKASSYAHGLLEIARSLGARWTAARISPAMARKSQISGRLLAVLDPERSRHGLGRRVALPAALGAAVLIVPLSLLQPIPAIHAASPQVTSTASATTAADDAKAIAAVYDEWKQAIARNDATAIADLHTSDTMIVTQSRPVIRGRTAVKDMYLFYFAFGLATADIDTQELYPVGDMLCELGTSEAFTRSGSVLSSGRHMTLWKKEDGKWRVFRDYAVQ